MGLTYLASLLLTSFLANGPAPKANDAVQIEVTGLPRTEYVSTSDLVPARLVEKAGEVERYILGSIRLELRSGNKLFWGQDRPVGFLAGASKVDSGWVFVSTDGSFYAAERFIGPLRRLGQIDQRFFLAPSRGRVACVDESGGLWTTLGGKGPARVKSLKDKAVLGAAFASASVGLALVAPGDVLYTADGGKTWEEADLGDNGAFAVGLDRNRLMMDTLDGRYVLTDQGEFALESTPETAPTSSLDRAKVERGLARQFPDQLAWKPRLADGRFVEVTGREIRFRDPETGEIVGKLPDALPKGSKTACRSAAFRGGVAFLCPSDEAPQLSVWFTKDGSTVTRMADLYGDIDTLEIASDTQGMAFRGFAGCKPKTEGTSADQLCVLLPGSSEATPAQFVLTDDSDIDGMSGSVVLVYHGTAGEEAAAHVLVHAKGGTRNIIDLREAGREEAFTEARITADGMAYVVVREVLRTKGSKEDKVGRVLRVLVADAQGGAKAKQVPANTMDFIFLDRDQALAVGTAASDLWWSGDAGKSWRALALPVDGDASALPSIPDGPFASMGPIAGESAVGPLLRCSGPQVCFAEFTQNRWLVRIRPATPDKGAAQDKSGKPQDKRVLAKDGKEETVAPEKPVTKLTDALFAASKRKSGIAPLPAASGVPADVDQRWLGLQCEPASPELLQGWTYEPADPSSTMPIQPRPFGGAEASLEFSVNIQGEARFRVFWNFALRKSTYSTSSKQSSPPWEDWVKPNVQRWFDKKPAFYRILGGSEGALWLERCVGKLCRQLAVPSDGIPVWLPSWSAGGKPLAIAEIAFDTDGTGYVHLVASPGLAAGDLHLLLRVSAEGALAQRRFILLPKWFEKEVHLAKVGGVYGLLGASWGSSQPDFLFFALGEENDSSPDLPGNRVATSCPPKSDTGTSYWDSTEYLLFGMKLGTGQVEAQRGGLIQWSLVNEKWCVSGVDLAVRTDLPGSMVGSGAKDHLDNPPVPTRKVVKEPTVTQGEDPEGESEVEAPSGGVFSGEFETNDDEPDGGESEGGVSDPVSVETIEASNPGVSFEDPAAEELPTRPTDLSIRLYFAAVQGMFTGYLVGGAEPLQLLCTATPVKVEHK